jgi:hypothetical protein
MTDDTVKPEQNKTDILDPAAEPAPEETQELAPEELPEAATTTTPERQVVYVHAPTPPKVGHNRIFGVLLALLGTVVFALVYLGVVAIYVAVTPGDDFQARIIAFLNTSTYWVPILYFALAFVVLALILNRAGWGAFVGGSLVVAVLVYVLSLGTLFLIQNNVTQLTPNEAQVVFLVLAGNAGIILAALVARETALWFGLAISVRGRKVRLRNAEARAAYDAEQAEKKAEYERAATTV